MISTTSPPASKPEKSRQLIAHSSDPTAHAPRQHSARPARGRYIIPKFDREKTTSFFPSGGGPGVGPARNSAAKTTPPAPRAAATPTQPDQRPQRQAPALSIIAANAQPKRVGVVPRRAGTASHTPLTKAGGICPRSFVQASDEKSRRHTRPDVRPRPSISPGGSRSRCGSPNVAGSSTGDGAW